jgi:hypothetical protein
MDEKTLKSMGLLDQGEDLQKIRWTTEINYLSPHVGIRQVLEDDGRWSINILIDEQTTKEEIKKLWPEIRVERARLARIQGHDISDYFRAVLYDITNKLYIAYYRPVVQPRYFKNKPVIHRLHYKNKPVYKSPQPLDLAMDVNFDLLIFFIRASQPAQGKDRAKLAEHYFFSLLQSFTISLDVIDDLKKDAEILFQEGECPFDIQSQPISESKMREKLRHIQKKEDDTVSSQNSLEAKRNLLSVHRLFLVWGDWQHGADLLIKTYPETYSKYKDRLNARITELLMDASSGRLVYSHDK